MVQYSSHRRFAASFCDGASGRAWNHASHSRAGWICVERKAVRRTYSWLETAKTKISISRGSCPFQIFRIQKWMTFRWKVECNCWAKHVCKISCQSFCKLMLQKWGKGPPDCWHQGMDSMCMPALDTALGMDADMHWCWWADAIWKPLIVSCPLVIGWFLVYKPYYITLVISTINHS